MFERAGSRSEGADEIGADEGVDLTVGEAEEELASGADVGGGAADFTAVDVGADLAPEEEAAVADLFEGAGEAGVVAQRGQAVF